MIEWLFIAIVLIGLVVFIGVSEHVLPKLLERFVAFVTAVARRRRTRQTKNADPSKLDSDDSAPL